MFTALMPAADNTVGNPALNIGIFVLFVVATLGTLLALAVAVGVFRFAAPGRRSRH